MARGMRDGHGIGRTRQDERATMTERQQSESTDRVATTPARQRVIRLQGRLLDGMIVTLIFIMLATLLGAIAGLVFDYADAIKLLSKSVAGRGTFASHTLIKATGQRLVSDVLSVFILIELFRSFTDYLEFHRIRLQVLAEVGFVFVLREVFVGLYANHLNWRDLLALGVLLAVLAATRVLATRFPPPYSSRR